MREASASIAKSTIESILCFPSIKGNKNSHKYELTREETPEPINMTVLVDIETAVRWGAKRGIDNINQEKIKRREMGD